MTNHSNRGRIKCAPIVHWRRGFLMALPSSLEPLAFTYPNFPQSPDGVLVRVKATGRLCKWVGGHIENLDQRKARAALDWMIRSESETVNGRTDGQTEAR